MAAIDWIFAGALTVYVLQRLGELALNRRNAARLRARGGHRVGDEVYHRIVVLHVAFFFALGAEWLWAPWAGVGWWSVPGLGLFLVGQFLRIWSMLSLGDRWTTQIYVVPGEPPVSRGPYRWLDHPIYLGVALELPGFALIFGLPATAVAATLVNLPLLRARIRHEEAALRAAGDAPPGGGARGSVDGGR